MNVLGYINNKLSEIINYEFGMWTSEKLVFPYWVGEYQELGFNTEQQKQEYSFTLTGTTNGTWLDLENDKKKIKQLFADHTAMIEVGHGVAVYFNTALQIPSEDETIKRMQIILTIHEWGLI